MGWEQQIKTSFMLQNFFKTAVRGLLKNKTYSFLNIAGLAIGMACSIMILLWVQNELSYDRFHKNANEIYRVTATAGDFQVAINPAPMVEDLQAKMPMIKNTDTINCTTMRLLRSKAPFLPVE